MSTDIVTTTEHENPLAHLPEELQRIILESSQIIQDSSAISINKIRLDAKTYILPDGTETNTFSGIIVGVKHANIHYAGEYEEGVTNPPDCVAVGDVACNKLTPHPTVTERFSVECNSCAKFQWGSAPKGKGKACGEHTLLALYIPSLGEDLFLIEEKKANSRAVDGYLANINNKFGHPVAVLTQFSIGIKNKWEQSFEAVAKVSPDLVVKLVERFDEANTMLVARIVDSYAKSTPVAANDAVEAASSNRTARARN